MEQLRAEIKRVEEALAKTNSPFLRRDYEKHLKKLKKQLKRSEMSG